MLDSYSTEIAQSLWPTCKQDQPLHRPPQEKDSRKESHRGKGDSRPGVGQRAGGPCLCPASAAEDGSLWGVEGPATKHSGDRWGWRSPAGILQIEVLLNRTGRPGPKEKRAQVVRQMAQLGWVCDIHRCLWSFGDTGHVSFIACLLLIMNCKFTLFVSVFLPFLSFSLGPGERA